MAVVVPSYNRSERLAPLFAALAKQHLPAEEFEVVVADDCSTDDTISVLEELQATMPFSLRIVRTPVNGGPAAARNLGWQHTSAPIVAFTDDDCDPSPEWLEAGLAAFEGKPNVGVVQGATRATGGMRPEYHGDWYVWRVIDSPSPYFEGCNLFFRRDVLEITGGFDEEIGYHGEDSAAGWRVLEAGFDREFAADAAVDHPVENRGVLWHMKMARLEKRIVWCAAKHPGFRQEAFFRPWAYRRADAAMSLALVGVIVGLRFRPAFLLTLPYLWWRRPSMRYISFFRMCLEVPLVDLVRAVSHLEGSVKYRILVL
jgi:GT2 family glycosyltransferase